MPDGRKEGRSVDSQYANSLSGQVLAYLGDAALEVLVRRFLVRLDIGNGGAMSKLALEFVRATAQSAGMDKIMPLLSEEEEYIFKRGRNAHGISIPKSASAVEYRRATGMEALFGYLDLCGRHERAEELFKVAYSDIIARIESEHKERSI